MNDSYGMYSVIYSTKYIQFEAYAVSFGDGNAILNPEIVFSNSHLATIWPIIIFSIHSIVFCIMFAICKYYDRELLGSRMCDVCLKH